MYYSYHGFLNSALPLPPPPPIFFFTYTPPPPPPPPKHFEKKIAPCKLFKEIRKQQANRSQAYLYMYSSWYHTVLPLSGSSSLTLYVSFKTNKLDTLYQAIRLNAKSLTVYGVHPWNDCVTSFSYVFMVEWIAK